VHDDIIAAATSEQLDVDDLGRVVDVVVDLDAVLGFELLDDARCDVVSPVLDVDDVFFT